MNVTDAADCAERGVICIEYFLLDYGLLTALAAVDQNPITATSDEKEQLLESIVPVGNSVQGERSSNVRK